MSSTPLDLRLFGIDLRAIGSEVKNAVLDLPAHPLLAWLSPATPICLQQVNGERSFWQGDKLLAASANQETLALLALEYPEEGVLRRTLTLPAMSAAAVANALTLEAYSSSPFPQADLVWGYRSQKNKNNPTLHIELVLASRRQVESYLQQQTQKNQAPMTAAPFANSTNLNLNPSQASSASNVVSGASAVLPEIWVLSTSPEVAANKSPIVLQGFGEASRANTEAKGRKKSGLLLFGIVLLMGAIMATPTLQLRQCALAAQTAFSALQKRTASLSEQRENLVKTTDRIQQLNTITTDQLDALSVINAITRALPDDSALLSLRASGQTINMYGQTENAAVLMTHLSTQPGLHNVKAPAPASRAPGAAKESFNIELTFNLQEIENVAAQSNSKDAPVLAPPPPLVGPEPAPANPQVAPAAPVAPVAPAAPTPKATP